MRGDISGGKTIRSSLLLTTTRYPAWLVAIATLVALVVFAGMNLARHHWDPLVFVGEGSLYRNQDPGGSTGYDGQFAYYIVSDPLHADAKLDAPAFRYLRILYPLLTWLLSLGGQKALIPWVLVGINLICLSAVSALLGELMAFYGAARWYGMAVPLSAGMLFALRQDLNEPLALALALGGLAVLSCGAEKNSRVWWAALLLALSALAKETGSIFAGAIVAWLLWSRKWQKAAVFGIGALGPPTLWWMLVSVWKGQTPLYAPSTRFEMIPFYGLRFTQPVEARWMLVVWIVIPTIAVLLALLQDAFWQSLNLFSFLVAANALFVIFMPRPSYFFMLTALRLAAGMMSAALVWLAASGRRRWIPLFVAVWLSSGVLMAAFTN